MSIGVVMVSLLPILHFALLRVDTLAVDCIIRRTLKGLFRLYPVPVLFVHRLPTMLPGCSAPVCVPRDSLFIWSPKALYNSVEAAAVVPEEFEVPFGKARIRREGTDLTIITHGNTTHFCLDVAERLGREGVGSVEVIDLRSLIPLDKEAIFSLWKTGKVMVVHEDKVFSGFAPKIAAQIAGEMFRCYLDAPVQRVGSTFTPVGFNPILERAILPNDEKIYKAAKELLEF